MKTNFATDYADFRTVDGVLFPFREANFASNQSTGRHGHHPRRRQPAAQGQRLPPLSKRLRQQSQSNRLQRPVNVCHPGPFRLSFRPDHGDECERRPARPPRPRGRRRLCRNGLRRRRRAPRRGRLQHLDVRLPGDHHRPLVLRPDRRHDLPADRQLRRQRRGRRVGPPLGRGPRGARDLPGALQLARRREPRRLPRPPRRPGDQRRRHPRADPPPPKPRGHEGRHLLGRPRRGVAAAQGAGVPRPRRPRPGARGDLREDPTPRPTPARSATASPRSTAA